MGGKLALKILCGCIVLALIGGVTALITSADTLSDYEKKQKDLEKKAQQYQTVIENTASDIQQKEEYKKALLSKITVLNEQIISGKNEIMSLDNEIEGLQSEIDTARDKISVQMENLKQRVKTIYLSGETTSLEIILGAKDFEDFLDKLELVAYMSNSDKKMITTLQNEIDAINKKKIALSDKKTLLSGEQEKLDSRQAEMLKLNEANEKLLGELYEKNAGAQDHLDETNKEMKEIDDQIKAYYADKAAQEKNAKISKEAEAKLAASRKALEQQDSSSSKASSVTSHEASSKNTSSYNTVT
ncbi:MAG: hypothetical protein IIT42_02595, partial [Clostridia bacterium]|nr:hypothetical protein [Clostridia bacterium]